MGHITSMETLPPATKWRTAAAVVREMIRYRRSQPLSEAVLQTDPGGTLILDRQAYDRIELGMDVDAAISIIGSSPYRDGHAQTLAWYTLGGSYVSLVVSRGRHAQSTVIGKSFSNIIAESCGFQPSNGHESQNRPRTGQAKTSLASWPAISTEKIARYFLMYSNQEQRRWFTVSMSGAVQFEIKWMNDRSSIEFEFDRKEPILWGEERFQQLTDPGSFKGRPKPFGIRNDISDGQIDKLWKAILSLGSPQALTVRNRLMAAVNRCDNFCTNESRHALLVAVQEGDYFEAERLSEEICAMHREVYVAGIAAKVKERERQGPVYGRDYTKEEYGSLWDWYKVLVYERDSYRCQHCGVRNDEHENPCYHLDHVTPVSCRGKTELSNLQLLCETCNLLKADKAEDEFPPEIRARWYKNRQRNKADKSNKQS